MKKTDGALLVAIAYLLHKTTHVFPILGGRKPEHLHANIEALEISLTPEQVASLETVKPFEKGFPYSFFVRLSCSPHVLAILLTARYYLGRWVRLLLGNEGCSQLREVASCTTYQTHSLGWREQSIQVKLEIYQYIPYVQSCCTSLTHALHEHRDVHLQCWRCVRLIWIACLYLEVSRNNPNQIYTVIIEPCTCIFSDPDTATGKI